MKEEIPSNIIKSLGDINLEGHVLKGTKIKAMIASEARAIHVNPATRDKTKLVWRKNRTNKTTQARGNNLGEDLYTKLPITIGRKSVTRMKFSTFGGRATKFKFMPLGILAEQKRKEID